MAVQISGSAWRNNNKRNVIDTVRETRRLKTWKNADACFQTDVTDET